MGKRIVLLFTACIIFITSVTASGGMQGSFFIVFPDVPAVEAPALKLLLSVCYPARAINRLVMQGVPLSPEFKQAPKKQNEQAPKDACFIEPYRKNIQKAVHRIDTVKIAVTFFSLPRTDTHVNKDGPPGLYGCIFLSLLMYIVVLSKSNIPGAVSFLSHTIKNPILFTGPGFFINDKGVS